MSGAQLRGRLYIYLNKKLSLLIMKRAYMGTRNWWMLIVGIIVAIILVVYISRDRESAAGKLYKNATHTESDIERATVAGVNKTIDGVENVYGSIKKSLK